MVRILLSDILCYSLCTASQLFLLLPFLQVSSWVTHIIITQPTHEDRKAVLSCILRLAQCCWNLGNFNTTVEILVGLRSVQ